MLKGFTLNKINVTKNALFFLSRAPTPCSYTFNLQFLYELKQKVHLSKTGCGIFHFQFRFNFIKVYTFVQQKAQTLWLYNVIIPFKIKLIENHRKFCCQIFLNCNKDLENSVISAWVGAPQKLVWRQTIKT